MYGDYPVKNQQSWYLYGLFEENHHLLRSWACFNLTNIENLNMKER